MTAFDWKTDYLALAGDPTDEAALRSAISRAFYAAYHTAAVFVRAKGLLVTGHTHTTVWRALATAPDPTRAAVGTRGMQLKLSREYADYHNPFPGHLPREARDALVEAQAVIDALDRLS